MELVDYVDPASVKNYHQLSSQYIAQLQQSLNNLQVAPPPPPPGLNTAYTQLAHEIQSPEKVIRESPVKSAEASADAI